MRARTINGAARTPRVSGATMDSASVRVCGERLERQSRKVICVDTLVSICCLPKPSRLHKHQTSDKLEPSQPILEAFHDLPVPNTAPHRVTSGRFHLRSQHYHAERG